MKRVSIFLGAVTVILLLAGCGNEVTNKDHFNLSSLSSKQENKIEKKQAAETIEYLSLDTEIKKLASHFSAVKFEGDYKFDDFLDQGGAASDQEVLEYLTSTLLGSIDNKNLSFETKAFGCSTISVENKENGYYFGRNFDWNHCDAMIIAVYPENAYASLSTVNMDFIKQSAGFVSNFLSDKVLILAGIYAPLDGMNEKGLCVSVNMIRDEDTISQNNEKSDITTTTAIRLLLDQAATVEEAITLLEQYDFHASMGYMIHLAISDQTGKSVAVEYIDNEIKVIDTKILTNFYLAEGEKNGIGTKQSHTRFELLEDRLKEHSAMDRMQVRDALSLVSKGNFGEFESTEWSVIFDQSALTAIYYHRENYDKSYAFELFSK